jgi:peptidoglycan/xylan/chitin deacetylase (PgdA/CDA1 family)
MAKPFERGIITLSFDDGWKSIYKNAVPLLSQNDLLGTFYIISRRDHPLYVTKDEVR